MALLPGEEAKGEYDVKFTYTIFPSEEVIVKGKVQITTFRLRFVPAVPAPAAKTEEKEEKKKKKKKKKKKNFIFMMREWSGQ